MKTGRVVSIPSKLFYFMWFAMIIILILLSMSYWVLIVEPSKSKILMVREKLSPSYVEYAPVQSLEDGNGMPPVYPKRNPEYPTRMEFDLKRGAMESHGNKPILTSEEGSVVRHTSHYQQVGVLVSQDSNEEKPIILGLFGKKVGSRDRWEYYVASDQYHMYKLPAQFKNRMCDEDLGCEEIYNDDEVTVPDYANKVFRARIYKYALPKM